MMACRKGERLNAVSRAAFLALYWRTRLVPEILSFSLVDGRNRIFSRVMFYAEMSFSFSEPVDSKLRRKIPNFSRFTLSLCMRWRGTVSTQFTSLRVP